MTRLAQLGLEGSFVFHSYPVILEIDPRVDHVFSGFHQAPESARRAILKAFGDDVSARIAYEGGVNETKLEDALKSELFVIPKLPGHRPCGLKGLVWVVDRLLGPGGCPWDQAQTHQSLKKYLVEETYELVDAIDQSDETAMKEELGDVLLQVVMHSQMKALSGSWDADAVAEATAKKLVSRHPHVFGDATAKNEEEVLKVWEAAKSKESPERSVLHGVPKSMPALARALLISERAARKGFEWPDLDAVWEKVDEETAEVKCAFEKGDRDEVLAEIGDLLFTVVNIARWMKVDPEDALRLMLHRFQARFEAMEAATETPLDQLTPIQWDQLWNQVKANLH